MNRDTTKHYMDIGVGHLFWKIHPHTLEVKPYPISAIEIKYARDGKTEDVIWSKTLLKISFREGMFTEYFELDDNGMIKLDSSDYFMNSTTAIEESIIMRTKENHAQYNMVD